MTAYFSSVVLTCLLTGALSWVAWRQRSNPVARAFCWVLVADCLLALCEILSMLAPDAAWAGFWFNLHFLFTASIPIVFLLFALAFYRSQDWVSKSWLAALWVVPTLSQISLWTNNLHGLWVKQDVIFHLESGFWIAQTNLRVPGVLFLVHTFYSALLLLTGITILLVAAWRPPRAYLRQSLLVSFGALTGLISALIPVFNPLPQLKFNPLIPGVGISGLLNALAILRFDFFKRIPTEQTEVSLSGQDAQEKRSLAFYLLMVVLVVAMISAAGFINYSHFKGTYLNQEKDELTSITNLKITQLVDWRKERLADAETLMNNAALSELLGHFMADRSDLQAQVDLQSWLDSMRQAYQYSDLYLFDPQGVGVLASSSSAIYPEHLAMEIPQASSMDRAISLDFYRRPNGNIYYSTLALIQSVQNGQTLGVIVLEVNPSIYLYPYIATWPTPSETTETLIVRRDGNDALFLNPLRFDPQAALNRRIPLTEKEVPAVRAVLGETGLVSGVDYRGEPVLAVIAPVPDSPWFIVTRIDQAEIYASLRQRLWQTVLFFGALGGVIIVGTGLLWRNQRASYFQARYQATEKLRESQKHFATIFHSSPAAIALTRMSDNILVDFNPAWVEITGYSRQEAVGHAASELGLWIDPGQCQALVESLLAKDSASGEIRLRHKSGEKRDLLMSAESIEIEGEDYLLTMAQDITERKQAEEQTQHLLAQAERARRSLLSALEDQQRAREQISTSEAEMRALFNAMTDVVIVYDADGKYIRIAPTDPANLYKPPANMLGKRVHEILPKDTADLIVACIRQALKNGKTAQCEYPLIINDQEIWFLANVSPLDKNTVFFIAHDFTKRKQAEEKTRQRLVEMEMFNRVSSALRVADTLEEMLPIFLNETLDALNIPSGSIVLYDNLKDKFSQRIARGWYEKLANKPPNPHEGIADKVMRSQKVYIIPDFSKDKYINKEIQIHIPPGWGGACLPVFVGHEPIGLFYVSVELPRQINSDEIKLLSALSEMIGNAIHRTRLHERTMKQLGQITALRDIDRTIAGSLDLEISLKEILNQTISQLNADAADFYLYNIKSNTLALKEFQGFISPANRKKYVAIGEGVTGHVALERQKFIDHNIQDSKMEQSEKKFFKDENITCYFGEPLIAKGHIHGVLEVFYRGHQEREQEVADFLDLLAGQAAIAIDNTELFSNLQSANSRLELAYDRTLEGWGRALELRDGETEGHSRRVTNMTLELAQSLGIIDDQLINIYRGALLHDIGKMAIPDSILLKPGPLDDDEWELMHKHPVYAYDMLKPIEYLRNALDIPQYHHEKWDGSGYPEGLKAEQIPLAARIFAIVDVWDALSSDRPYRKAWSTNKVLEYLKDQSGKHFDPMIVDKFLKLLESKKY
jgi:PAS domain S-box-containing protein